MTPRRYQLMVLNRTLALIDFDDEVDTRLVRCPTITAAELLAAVHVMETGIIHEEGGLPPTGGPASLGYWWPLFGDDEELTLSAFLGRLQARDADAPEDVSEALGLLSGA